MTLLRGDAAAPPRTLVDILTETAAECPDDPAIDNGTYQLTYAELIAAASDLAEHLSGLGVGPGDKVGVRISSGTLDLYVAILGVLVAGAAYVPVDADDPEERARTVFGEAEVVAVISDDLAVEERLPAAGRTRHSTWSAADEPGVPGLDDDCWVIFTSGSTGKPKGVAVTHRSAAAFVDAEARLFLTAAPIGVGDRVMAGLSVAFDASCEEMWLAWRYGACLVPAPRSLVRSGVDLGPWLIANDITVVSTVPTLLSMWPAEALAKVRLLILGGEAAPAEIGTRYATASREVWNTYGPTEATVVACAAPLDGSEPVRIGLPLDGWDLAVVGEDGLEVPEGETGELIIGGVGLARYLDPVKDAEKYAAMPGLGWARAYRSGDRVINDPAGLIFAGRADEQIKLGGRRIELGEIDAALMELPGVSGGAVAIRRTEAGNSVLIGYLTLAGNDFDLERALAELRGKLPAPMVPRLAEVETLPTRTSGKIDRDALPWPVPTLRSGETGSAEIELTPTEQQLAEAFLSILGVEVRSASDNFFDLGGGSLTAAQLVSRLRGTHPEVTVAEIYANPVVGKLAGRLDSMSLPANLIDRSVPPTPLKSQAAQHLGLLGARWLAGLRTTSWLFLAELLCAPAVSAITGWTVPVPPWPLVVFCWLVFLTPPGRMLLTAALVRTILAGIGPGNYPRGGKVHLRVWLAERVADSSAATMISSAPWMTWYARLLGARIGRDADLHALPPVTGQLRVGGGASIEPEVDLTGHWLDGDTLHLGEVRIGAGARVGTRSTLLPGSVVGRDAEVMPGSAVFGEVGEGERWSGAPARKVGKARGGWDEEHPPHRPLWSAGYGALALLISALPVLAVLAGAGVGLSLLTVPWLALLAGAATGYLVLALLILMLVRILGLGLKPGHHPVHSRPALQAWGTMRVLDEARTWLFPLYSSALTPVWLRALGARIGADVEASTVLMIPSLVSVGDGAFLADDTLVGPYELVGGRLRIERSKVGKRAFVGNSGMTAPGRKVPKRGLVAVLSSAPGRKDKARSGTSWIGSPPVQLRRQAGSGDDSRTYRPGPGLRLARSLVEACRVLPMLLHVALAASVVAVLVGVQTRVGLWAVPVVSGPVLMLAGLLAALVSTLAKWSLVGRIRAGDHPLWSSFVWRNELADTFVECLAAPWLARHTPGSPVLVWWLRSLGARIGRGVWCETYWLPEADLIELADGATVNRGCVVQTHLFHDRVLSMDEVRLRTGATLGQHGVILPAATIGRHATVGPVSLVMRGESVPNSTRWIGNPIGPWTLNDPLNTGRPQGYGI